MSYILMLLQLVAWGYVAYISIDQARRHDQTTSLVVRTAYIALATAGVSGAVGCLIKSNWFDCIAAAGVALFLFANRKALNAKSGPTA